MDWGAIYNLTKLILSQLRQIIIDACNTVPDSYIGSPIALRGGSVRQLLI